MWAMALKTLKTRKMAKGKRKKATTAATSVNKTVKTKQSVASFLATLPDEARRRDCKTVAAMMQEATGATPRMWGASIVGFGDYHYKYESGREADWFQIGFSPRKSDLTLYVMSGVHNYPALLGKLGKHSTGKSCLYIKRLTDIDTGVLEELIRAGVKDIRAYAAKTQA
jgi:hypothetical protein